jgi:hypothetical protein
VALQAAIALHAGIVVDYWEVAGWWQVADFTFHAFEAAVVLIRVVYKRPAPCAETGATITPSMPRMPTELSRRRVRAVIVPASLPLARRPRAGQSDRVLQPSTVAG